MKRIFVILLTLAVITTATEMTLSAQTKSRSESVVYINGVRYYVHTVTKGDTMYSLSKSYGVESSEILEANPMLGNGLRLGINIKIPHKGDIAVVELSERKHRKTFNEHTVTKGETLFSISRQFELSVDTILEDNPELDPAALSIGQVLKIRKSELGKTSEEETRQAIDGYRKNVNSVAPAGLKYYYVEPSDQLNTIAIAHEMSLENLKRVNNIQGEEVVHIGDMLLVRDAQSPDATPAYTSDRKAEIERIVESVDFSSLSANDTLDVAVLLPLSVDGRPMKPFVEFYQGLLLAAEDLRRDGRNVSINLFNTDRSAERVNEIIKQENYRDCELIIGPVFEELLRAVLYDAELRSVPVISPLATLNDSDSPVLFQMAPDTKHRYDKIEDLLGEDRKVTLIEGEDNDEEFRKEVMNVLASRDVEYAIHKYKYEHPTAITDREKASKRALQAARARANARGEYLDPRVVDSLSAKPSMSDLTPLLMGKSGNESIHHTLFVLSDNEVEVDRILSALSSAYAAQIAINRGSNRNIHDMIQYDVVANPEWRRYKNIDRAIYFRNQVVAFSSYLASRESEKIRQFDSRYAVAYGELPSLYSYRGYDVLRIFGEGLYSDILYNMQGRTYQPLQSEYRFEREEDHTKFVNTNWIRESYNSNFTKEIK